MFTSISSYLPSSRARYNMVDKISGQEVGFVTLREVQDMPNLGQVELHSPVVGQQDASKDMNSISNIDEPKKLVSRLVSGLVDSLDGNFQWSSEKKLALNFKLCDFLLEEIDGMKSNRNFIEETRKSNPSTEKRKKPFNLGWLRRVALSGLGAGYVSDVWYVAPPDNKDGSRHELRGKTQVEIYLSETGNGDLEADDFDFRKKVLGLPSGFESTIRINSPNEYKKPFKFGWLRKVTIRLSDRKVTCVGYLTPPDSEGKTLRFCIKKDVAEYLDRVGDKDLHVDDFVITRKVLGLSARFEEVGFTNQATANRSPVDKDLHQSSEKKVIKTEQSDAYVDKDDIDSSYDTIVDSSSDDSSDGSDSSDSDDSDDENVSDCSDAIVPALSNISEDKVIVADSPVCLELSTNRMNDIGSVTAFLKVSSSQSTSSELSPALSFNPAVTSSPATSFLSALPSAVRSPSSVNMTVPVPTATVRMISNDQNSREGGRRMQTMRIKCKVKIRKGMEMFGRRFGQDLKTLQFFLNDRQLTGEEVTGTMDGAVIRVEGLH